MNIFLTDRSPQLCARMLDDLRLNKMILETTQMLSVAFRKRWPHLPASKLYKETHAHHACTVWVGKTDLNFLWTWNLLHELLVERRMRTKREHACEDLFHHFGLAFKLLEHEYIPLTKAAIDNVEFSFDCSGQKVGDVFENYKLCMIKKWNNDIRPPTWLNTNPPEWYLDPQEILKLAENKDE